TMARPPLYHTDAEKPVTVSVRIPRALYAQAQQYVSMRRTTLTEVLVDGLRLRLETPADPRDVLVSQDTTVIQELQEMIRAAVHKEIGTLSDFLGPQARAAGLLPTPAAPPRGGIQHYENTTVIQELAKPAYLVDECLPFDEDLAPALGALTGPPPAILPDATPGGQDTVPPAPATIEAQIDQHITRLEDRIHEMHALNGESEVTVCEISQDDNTTVLHEREVAVQGGGTDTPAPAPPRPRPNGPLVPYTSSGAGRHARSGDARGLVVPHRNVYQRVAVVPDTHGGTGRFFRRHRFPIIAGWVGNWVRGRDVGVLAFLLHVEP